MAGFGGHIVSGHVDGTGRIVEVKRMTMPSGIQYRPHHSSCAI